MKNLKRTLQAGLIISAATMPVAGVSYTTKKQTLVGSNQKQVEHKTVVGLDF
jgi:hypothetical protein